MFEKVARYYDIVMHDFDYEGLVDYLDDLIINNGGERTTLLDLGCGTGEELIYFRQLGYHVSGLDISSEMLDVCQQKFPDINLYHQDMTKIKINKKFDNIICIFDSINYILDRKKLLKVFKSCYNLLNDGGIFLFDFNTLYGLMNYWYQDRFEEGKDYFIAYSSEINYDRQEIDVRMKFFIEQEDKKYITFVENHKEKCYTKEIMKSALYEAGFNNVKFLPFLSKKATKSSEVDRYQVIVKK